MDLLRTLLIYMTMIFVSSVQTAPEPTIIPEPTAIVEATATPTQVPTPTPTPVPTPAITPNTAYKTIKVGDNGDAVSELQAKLAEYGYYTGDIDGRFGNQTRRAVEQFQYANGLQIDGIAGKGTLTVLFESDEVRPAPTPSPDPNALATAKPETADTPIPIPGQTATPPAAAEPTAEPTDAPAELKDAEGDRAADKQTDISAGANLPAAPENSVSPEASPDVTDEPSAAPAEFARMEGYTISLAGSDEPLFEKASEADGATDAEPVPLEPCIYGEDVYVPLMRILAAANVLVIPNETMDITEYAFALGEYIYRIEFTENQEGEPSELAAYMGSEAQTLPVRDVRISQGEVYLPMESIESLTGMHFDIDDERKLLTVTMP